MPHSRPGADKVQRRGHMVNLSWQSGTLADTWWAHARQRQEARTEWTRLVWPELASPGVRFGRAPNLVRICPPCVGHVSALCPLLACHLSSMPALCPPCARLASATWRCQSELKADTWRTHGAQAPGFAAASLLSKREPHRKPFGEKS